MKKILITIFIILIIIGGFFLFYRRTIFIKEPLTQTLTPTTTTYTTSVTQPTAQTPAQRVTHPISSATQPITKSAIQPLIQPINVAQTPAYTSENTLQFSYATSFTRMIISLLAIMGLLVITFWVLKRVIKHRSTYANSMQAIKILEKRVLSPKSVLYLVEFDGEKVLISESQLEVRALQSITNLEHEN